MAQMNREWAIGKLKEFLDTAALTYVPDSSNTIGFWHYKLTNPQAEVQAAAQIVEQILDRVITDWRTAEWENRPSSRCGATVRRSTGRSHSWKPSRN